MEIKRYEAWMYDQVVSLLFNEYGFSRKYWEHFMDNFYGHPYQQNKSVKIAAVENKKVVGFIGHFHWPYLLNGTPTNSYQSGNLIVDPNFRRRGIFNMMQAFFEEVVEQENIDFLVGIPEDTSYPGLIKQGWVHLFDMDKYVKLLNPLTLFRKNALSTLGLPTDEEEILAHRPEQTGFVLDRNTAFVDWWSAFSPSDVHRFFTYRDTSKTAVFNLKAEVERIRNIEVVTLAIGRIQTNCHDAEFLSDAIKALVKAARKQNIFTFLYIALNSNFQDTTTLGVIRRNGFWKINPKRKLHFIVKDYTTGSKVCDPRLWELYKSDKDTW